MHDILESEVDRAAQACRDRLERLAANPGPAIEAAKQGLPPAQAHGLPRAELERLYRVAKGLCDAGRFEDALPIALCLASHDPTQARHAFIAGSCLQRTGRAREAAGLYWAALAAGQKPVAAFRMGECFAALGEKALAAQAFETTYDMGRGRHELRELQDRAAAALAAL